MVDGHISTDGTVLHKISGTKLGAILGKSPYSTPFQAACGLLGLATEDISDKPAVKTGIALEDKIIRYVGKSYADIGVFMSADEVFEKRDGKYDTWVSDFEDDVYAGHVDGVVFGNDGGTYILEVKTTSNIAAWENGVPEHYFWQVALYNHYVTKADKAYVALGIVNSNTYRDPGSWVPSDETVMLFEMAIDREMVAENLRAADAWYADTVLNNVTPAPDEQNEGDMEMYEHLSNIASSVDEMEEKVTRLAMLNERIATAEEAMSSLVAERDTLKASLKEYMVANNLSSLDSTDKAWTAGVRKQTRSTIDASLLVKAGIDPKPFTVESETKVFTLKAKKNKKEE